MAYKHSIVSYHSDYGNDRCGYCKTYRSKSNGMDVHIMTCQDYQDLIDRGWRRSGHYCYKPNNQITCCPSYTIKCDTLNFKLSKSHKKILKRMNKFLKDGIRSKDEESLFTFDNPFGINTCDANLVIKQFVNQIDVNKIVNNLKFLKDSVSIGNLMTTLNKSPEDASSSSSATIPPSISTAEITENKLIDQEQILQQEQEPQQQKQKSVTAGAGPDNSKPPCKKARLLRIERKEQKTRLKNDNSVKPSVPVPMKSCKNREKSIEDFLNEIPTDGVHKLRVTLVPSNKGATEEAYILYQKYQISIHNDPPSKIRRDKFHRFLCHSPLEVSLVPVRGYEFSTTVGEEYDLYEKYQTKIHNDPPDDVEDFLDFLQKSPLQPVVHSETPPKGYGSFHQQYWLDDRLIAVGVIDILPSCVSSVYFFYDPDYSFLSLGTYGSLHEVAFTRELQKKCSDLKYYYMGFYIHSCPKMRYKGKLYPSYLLCSEVFTWHLINDALLKRLDESKYQRFNEDPTAEDKDKFRDEDLQHIPVLSDSTLLRYSDYLQQNNDNVDEVLEYGSLVGRPCSRRMLLIRK